MNQITLRLIASLSLAAALFAGPSAFAQATFTAGSYTQNFSSMGTGTVTPTGWSAVSESGSHNTFSPNVSGESNASVAPLNPNFTAGTLSTSPIEALTPTQGSSTGKGVDGVNWVNSDANISAGEGTHSFGSDPSGNAATILELSMTNNTGSAINAVNIAYDIDRFTTVVDNNGVSSSAPNYGVEEFPGYQLFYNLTPSNTATWVNVSSLNPTVNMGTTGGVQVPNTVGITTVPTTMVNLNSAWTAGSTISFAWLDDNGYSPSPDQEIGLNNVVISVAAVPEPSSGFLGLVAVGAAFTLLRLRRRRA
jgi:hypothetical protein